MAATPAPADSADGSIADGSIVCRPVRREEVQMALRMIFTTAGGPAEDAQVTEFLQFADSRGISTRDLWVAERRGRVLSAVLPIYSPGWTVLLLSPGEMPAGYDAPAVPLLVNAVCAAAAGRGAHLAQVLLEPIDEAAQALYAGHGFKRMAELLYLQVAVPRRAALPALPPGHEWVGYSPATHGLFASVIAQTYVNSLDCPGLNGLRSIDDVIAGHKASGEFDPALWFVLRQAFVRRNTSGGNAGGGDAGGANLPGGDGSGAGRAVLLLSRLPRCDVVELVYLGLTPVARGRGLGSLLMRQAIGTVARTGRARLTLAVDSANVPALKLYHRHGMQQVASRIALMRDLRTSR